MPLPVGLCSEDERHHYSWSGCCTAGTVPQDPQDKIFLSCAVDANAGSIMSHDRHLLVLHTYKNIPILTGKQFAERLEKQA
jgi:predicted nucleic acid-binding protein